jgi:nucleoside-diphosphate-sugar epimerase
MTKHAFLTGATGQAGGDVLAEMVRRGFEVTALVRKPVQLSSCRIIVGDLFNPAPFAAEVEASDMIVHLASSRSAGQDEVLGDIASSADIIDHWKRGAFICVSSGSLHPGNPVALDEGMPLAIGNGYALGKACNEFQLRMAAGVGQRGPGISLRPGIFFGAGQRRNDRRVLRNVYEGCQSNAKYLFCSEEGLESFGSSFIGTADFGRAVSDALALKISGPYNVSGGFCTWRQLIETMNRCAGTHADFLVRPTGPSASGEFALPQYRRFLDTARFNQATSFVPQQTLEQLVEDYVGAEQTTVARRN